MSYLLRGLNIIIRSKITAKKNMENVHKILLSIISICFLLLLGSCEKDNESSTPEEWNYENAGNWGGIGYAECKGRVQSPINIETSTTIKANLPALQLNYTNALWGIIDNGHTIQINLKKKNTLFLD